MAEIVLCDVLPTVLGCLLLGSHFLVQLGWIALRIWETCAAHSGYALPLCPFSQLGLFNGPQVHDFHHSHNVGTYGAMTRFWDAAMVRFLAIVSFCVNKCVHLRRRHQQPNQPNPTHKPHPKIPTGHGPAVPGVRIPAPRRAHPQQAPAPRAPPLPFRTLFQALRLGRGGRLGRLHADALPLPRLLPRPGLRLLFPFLLPTQHASAATAAAVGSSSRSSRRGRIAGPVPLGLPNTRAAGLGGVALVVGVGGVGGVGWSCDAE